MIECDCGMRVLSKSLDGNTRLRSKVLVFDEDGNAIAICRNCGKEHPIPDLHLTIEKSKRRKRIIVRNV